MKFHSPYQFIPVDANRTPTLRWQREQKEAELGRDDNKYARHDYWHKGGWSGRITCTLTCRSALVVGGKQHEGSKKKPGRVEPYKHPDGSLAIPGNSLRGMIASLVETISQSSLRVLTKEDETVYSQRKRHKEALTKIGLLRRQDEKYFLYPLTDVKDTYRVALGEPLLKKGERCYQHRDHAEFVYAELTKKKKAKNLVKEQTENKTPGILYRRGKQSGKKSRKRNEIFIAWDGVLPKKPLTVDSVIIQRFEGILRMRHEADEEFSQLPVGYKRSLDKLDSHIVEDGDLLYYDADRNGKVTELSYSAIWRKPVDGSLHQAFARTGGKNSLPWNAERDGLTPAEQLFGVVEDNPPVERAARNLASRVRFTDARPLGSMQLGDPVTLKILASPKPPSPAMYFSAANGGYISKRQLDLKKHSPNGRKHYLPQKQVTPVWATDIRDNDRKHNWKPHLRVRPIPAKSKFSFEIHFENLAPEELDLLHTALQPAKDFVHRLGLGKPLGLGQVSLAVTALERIDRIQRYTPEGLSHDRYVACELPDVRRLIDKDTLDLMATIGNPEFLTEDPVCYPFTEQQGAYAETKGFKWFVTNDRLKSDHQYLKKVIAGKKLRPIKALNETK